MLLDDVMEEGLTNHEDPHPHEGVLIDGVFVRAEEETREVTEKIPKFDDNGDPLIDPQTNEPLTEEIKLERGTGRYKLMKYDNVSVEDAVSDEMEDGEVLLTEDWASVAHFFERQLLVLRGELTQDELDDEIKNRSSSSEPAVDPRLTAKAQQQQSGQQDDDDDDDDDDDSDDTQAAAPQDQKALFAEIGKNVNWEGLPYDRCMDYIKFDMEAEHGIGEDQIDESALQEFVWAQKQKADQDNPLCDSCGYDPCQCKERFGDEEDYDEDEEDYEDDDFDEDDED